MGALLLLAVPVALLLVPGLLGLSWALERRIFSPQSMIVTAARSRRSAPEFAEAFVAGQVERLLKEAQRR